jgi:alpha-N-arabinofuranosidase
MLSRPVSISVFMPALAAPSSGTERFYAANDTNNLGDIPSGRLAYPSLQGAAAEAAFMTGMERNSDVVFASAC